MLPFSRSSTIPSSQPGSTVMDPFHSYASRFISWDGRESDDNDLEGPRDPILRSIVVEEPRNDSHIEFKVRVDAISAVSPYIKTMFAIYPTKKRLGITAAKADDMQILLKYMHTGIYNPTDISYRHRNKHDIVFRHIDFYLFCQKLGYKSLMDVVRAGIQVSLDVMTWSPIPTKEDNVLLHPREGSSEQASFVPLLTTLFLACESYYPEIKQDDPIKTSLLVYSYHLWQKFDYGRSTDPSLTQYDPNSKLWVDLTRYHNTTRSVDIYHKAPEYDIRPLISWGATFVCIIVIAIVEIWFFRK